MGVIGRRTALDVVHFTRLYGVGGREPAAVRQSHAGLGAEAAHPAAAGVAEHAKSVPVEEVSRTARQAIFHGCWRRGNHHVEQVHTGSGSIDLGRLVRRQKDACTLPGTVRLPAIKYEATDRIVYDVQDMIEVTSNYIELPAWCYGSPVDRQRVGTAKPGAAQFAFQAGRDRRGCRRVRIDDVDVLDACHFPLDLEFRLARDYLVRSRRARCQAVMVPITRIGVPLIHSHIILTCFGALPVYVN